MNAHVKGALEKDYILKSAPFWRFDYQSELLVYRVHLPKHYDIVLDLFTRALTDNIREGVLIGL